MFGGSLPMLLGGALLALSTLGGLYYAIDSHGFERGEARGLVKGEKKGRDLGYRQALTDIVQKKQEALNAARRLRSQSDACADTGGVWNSATLPDGLCERP